MIELKDISFTYPRSRRAILDRLSLQLGSGTIAGLFGPNGSGKSTLLKILSGLLFPQAGECHVLSATPSQRNPGFLADVYLLPEDIFVPKLSAEVYIKRFAPFYPKFDRPLMDKLLQEFRLPSDQELTALSLGQKKKFLLSFAIATNARLLLLDEPSNGLDIPSKAQFRKVLIDHSTADRSYIISTHQAHDLEGLIDSVIFLAEGKIQLNRSLEFIGSKIRCGREFSAPESALYFESTLDGYAVIDKNTEGEESQINLELLFNFINSSPENSGSALGEASE